MDASVTAEPDRACPGCPGTGWITGWRSAWGRGPRGPQRLPDVPRAPEPCHRCNPDGRRGMPVAAPEAEAADDVVVGF